MSFFRRRSAKKERSNSVKKKPGLPGTKEPTPILPEDSHGKSDGRASREGLLMVEDEFFPGDLGMSLQPQDEYAKKSRLCKDLPEVLKDHEEVAYFIQYMESCKATALIRFWLDSESFQASTWTRIRTHSLQSVSKSSLATSKSNVSTESLVKSVNKDITSPVSGTSLDIANQQQTGSSSAETGSRKNSSSSAGQTGSEKTGSSSAETGSETTGSQENHSRVLHSGSVPNSLNDSASDSQTVTSDGETSVNQSNDITNTPVNKMIDSGPNVELSLKDCDSRVREKCKSTVKTDLNLPVVTCDNSVESQTEDSAISYRDLASPSSTDGDSEASLKHRRKPSSSNNLADKLKKSVEQDAVRIFTRYLAQEAVHPIGINDDLRNNTIRKICREDGQVDPECFVECQTWAVNKMKDRYFEGYKASVYHCKYQVEVLTGGKLHLTDILYDDTAMFYFMEYMEQEGLSDMLQFTISADNFQHLLNAQETYDGVQAQEDAMVLYDKFFSLQAASPLGFTDAVRFEVEGNICREEGPLPDCFAKPRKIVLHTIQRRHLQHYLTSDVYYKYLSELVSTVQTAQDFPLAHKKRRGSETSSEHSMGATSIGGESISSKNTLLATGNSHSVQFNKLDENMRSLSMDSSFLNANLWERPDSGKLTLGQIDGLGQFVSKFDPDPECPSTSQKNSTAGSKFFKSKKDKKREQEEMARKVAEMILKDVTSVTEAVGAIKKTGDV